ncbi:MAG: DNA glycosylase [Lachnospiraceae bacterium]|nr:DNA glycosylase [Lachnospiraceae bacterium]
MIREFKDDMDPLLITESGQCFRWCEVPSNGKEKVFRILAGGRVLFLIRRGSELDLSCSEKEYDSFWSDYLDSENDYRAIRGSADKEDDFLRKAAEAGKGIRILKQDPFETLISFIISQRKNIPAIRSSVEKICALAGKRIELGAEEIRWLKEHSVAEEAGASLFSFPDPEELFNMPEKDLDSCSLGYRKDYVKRAAEDVFSGKTDLNRLMGLDDEELFSELLEIRGVGKKVASCTALFGFHRLDFFPVDVWIDRVLKNCYPAGFPFERYRPFNGVMQQYMFFYGRSTTAV